MGDCQQTLGEDGIAGGLPRNYSSAECAGGWHAEAGGVKIEISAASVFKEAFQGVIHRPECNFVPRDVAFADQSGFERFLAGIEIEVQELCAVDDVDLADVRDVDKGEHRAKFDPRTGFFQGFTQRGLSAGLVVFHEAGW